MNSPVNTFKPTANALIYNGSPTRSIHLANVDQWATWLALSKFAMPMTPYLFTCSNNDTSQAGSPVGLVTSNLSFDDYVTIPLLIPAGCNFVLFGFLMTGWGTAQAISETMSDEAQLKMVGEGNNLGVDTLHGAEHMSERWCQPGGIGAEVNKPISMIAAGDDGCLVPRRINVQMRFKKTGGEKLAIHCIYFDYFRLPAGTDLTAFETTNGGFPAG